MWSLPCQSPPVADAATRHHRTHSEPLRPAGLAPPLPETALTRTSPKTTTTRPTRSGVNRPGRRSRTRTLQATGLLPVCRSTTTTGGTVPVRCGCTATATGATRAVVRRNGFVDRRARQAAVVRSRPERQDRATCPTHSAGVTRKPGRDRPCAPCGERPLTIDGQGRLSDMRRTRSGRSGGRAQRSLRSRLSSAPTDRPPFARVPFSRGMPPLHGLETGLDLQTHKCVVREWCSVRSVGPSSVKVGGVVER